MVVIVGDPARSIGYVPDRTAAPHLADRPLEAALTRRRAVDFCRVATAICPARPGGSQPAARLCGGF